MKLKLFTTRLPSEAGDENDIDIAPVMNMFIILVVFLVSMAVFTHVAIIDFSLPPNVGTGTGPGAEKPKLKLTVRLGSDYLGIVMGENLLDSLPVIDGNFPFAELGDRLSARRGETAETEDILVAPVDRIAFKRVVTVMDLCRDNGFSKIGLSSATDDPEAPR